MPESDPRLRRVNVNNVKPIMPFPRFPNRGLINGCEVAHNKMIQLQYRHYSNCVNFIGELH